MTNSLFRVGAPVALFCLTLSACAPAPPRPVALSPGDYSYLRAYMSWYIQDQMDRHKVPGLSIALVDAHHVIWQTGFGYADRENKIPASGATVYQVGSISKLFTAAAAMQGVEHGEISLDRGLTTYLPDFSIKSRWPEPAPLTPRALLSHHAGLPTYYLKGFFSTTPLTQMVQELNSEHLAYPPGQVFNYSNLGPNLMGLVMERLGKRPFADHMQARLLDPLDMRNSSFVLRPDLQSKLARGYVENVPTGPVRVRDVPSGGLYSSVADLSHFLRMILNGGEWQGQRLLSAASVKEMLSPQFAGSPLDFSQQFGIGWMLSGIPINGGGTVAWHNGSTRAYTGQLIALPDKGLGVVVLANSDSAAPAVYDVAEKALQLALEARDGIRPSPKAQPPFITLAEDVLDRYVGDYSLMGTLARVERNGSRLLFHVLDHTLELTPVSETEFRARYRLLGLVPITIPFPPIEFVKVGERQFALLRDRGVVTAAEKIPAYTISSAWRARVGDYSIINPDEHYLVNLDHCRMIVEDERLLLDIRISGLDDRRVKIVVVPLSDTEAYVFGLGRNVGDVTRVLDDGQRTRMQYSGYIFERQSPATPDRTIASAPSDR